MIARLALDRLRSALQTRGMLTRSDVINLFRGRVASVELERLLVALEQAGELRRGRVLTYGRPAQSYTWLGRPAHQVAEQLSLEGLRDVAEERPRSAGLAVSRSPAKHSGHGAQSAAGASGQPRHRSPRLNLVRRDA